jgi:hypothetical protein
MINTWGIVRNMYSSGIVQNHLTMDDLNIYYALIEKI